MMRTLDPTPRGDRGLRKANEGRDANIDKLEQRLLRLERAAPAAAGGIVGQAEFFSNSGTVQVATSEDNALFADVTYEAPYDPTGEGGDVSWVTFDSAEPFRIFLEPGWYGVVMTIQLSWTTEAHAPATFGPYMQGGLDNPHQGYGAFAQARLSSTTWGLLMPVNYGLVKASASVDFHAECRFTPVTGGPLSAPLSFIGWTITKFS